MSQYSRSSALTVESPRSILLEGHQQDANALDAALRAMILVIWRFCVACCAETKVEQESQ